MTGPSFSFSLPAKSLQPRNAPSALQVFSRASHYFCCPFKSRLPHCLYLIMLGFDRMRLDLSRQNLLRTPLATSPDLISFLGVTANMYSQSELSSNGMHGFGFDWTVRTGGASNTIFSPSRNQNG